MKEFQSEGEVIIRDENLNNKTILDKCDLLVELVEHLEKIDKSDICSSDSSLLEIFNHKMCERLFKLVSASKEICTWLSFKDISDVTLQLADLKPDLCHSNTRKSMSFSNDYIPLWEYHISPVNLDIFKNLSILEFGHTDFKGGVVPEEKYATNLSMMVESFEEELDQVRSSHDFQDGMIPCLIQSLISTESVD